MAAPPPAFGVESLTAPDARVTLDQAHDLMDKTGVFRRYRLRGRPTTVFVDASGRIKGVHAGELESDDLTELLDRYLGVQA